jgi:hypothetical protein
MCKIDKDIFLRYLNHVLGFGTRASTLSAFGMTRELHHLLGRECQNLLELATDAHKDLLAFLWGTTFAACNISVAATWDALANCTGPDTDTVEALSDIADDSHDLAIAFLLQGLADGSEHNMEPQLVNINELFLLELV